jgi:cell division protein FtsB
MPFRNKLRLKSDAALFTMLLMQRLKLYLRREWLALALAGVCALLAADFLRGPLGMRDLIALRDQRVQLEITHQRLLQSNSALKLKLSRVRGDPRYLERLVRQQLGYVRPDEIVYRFAADTATDR